MSKESIDKLESKLKAMEERLRAAKARDVQRERKADNKRKYLLGAVLMEWMEEDPSLKETATKRLDTFLIRASDRRYFGMTTKKKKKDEPSRDENAA